MNFTYFVPPFFQLRREFRGVLCTETTSDVPPRIFILMSLMFPGSSAVNKRFPMKGAYMTK